MKLSRREFFAATAAIGAAEGQQRAGAPVSAFELDELTIAQLQKYTSQSLVEKYLARIGAIDRAGPTLRAVIEINPDALAIARSLDDERKAGHVRGPLQGIPILIKSTNVTHTDSQAISADVAVSNAGTFCPIQWSIPG